METFNNEVTVYVAPEYKFVEAEDSVEVSASEAESVSEEVSVNEERETDYAAESSEEKASSENLDQYEADAEAEITYAGNM